MLRLITLTKTSGDRVSTVWATREISGKDGIESLP